MTLKCLFTIAAALWLAFALGSAPAYAAEQAEAEETENPEVVQPVDQYFKVITEREVKELKKPLPEEQAEEILTGKIIFYPEDWPEITERRRKLLEPEEEDWRKEYRGKLAQKVSFKFKDTKLEDVIAQVRVQTGLNMVLDPKSAQQKYRDHKVTLELADIKLDYALNWILRPIDLGWTLYEGAILISDVKTVKQAKKKSEVPVVYDVLELTTPIPDFIGPSLEWVRRPRRKDFWSDAGFERAWERYERARFGGEILRPPRIRPEDLVRLVRAVVGEEEPAPEQRAEELIEREREQSLEIGKD